jgi:PhnB protein
MIITPTLHFCGQCKEAIDLYQKAFDCRVDFILDYAQADKRDWNMELSEIQKNYVYHAELYIGEQRIMMADEFGIENEKSNSIFLTVTF